MEKTQNTNASTQAAPQKTAAIYMIAIIAIALNMRFGITHFSSALPLLEQRYGVSPTIGGIIGAIPLFCFAIGGIMTNKVVSSAGIKNTLLASSAMMVIGFVIRSFGGDALYIVGTTIAMLGLAFCNIVLPSLIKLFYPEKVQTLTIVMASSMAIGAFAGTIVNSMLTKNPTANVPMTLIADAILAAVAFVVVLFMSDPRVAKQPATEGKAGIPLSEIWKDPFAKMVTAYFALQALIIYTLIAELPSVLVDNAHMSVAQAGPLLGYAMLIGVPGYMVIAKFTKTDANINKMLMFLSSLMIISVLWLWLAPGKGMWVMATVLGIGMCIFPVMLSVIASYGKSHHEVTALSTLAQSAGYLVAAIGPIGAGVIHTITNSWTVPLVLVLIAAILQMIVGIVMMKAKTKDDETLAKA